MNTPTVIAIFVVIAAMLGFLLINSSNKAALSNANNTLSLSPTLALSTGTTSPTPQTSATQPSAAPATGKQYSQAPAMSIDKTKKYTATIETNKGAMTAELYAKDNPITVNNFVFLAKDHFYDNVKFHRIIKGFMEQTGDPKGDGTGGPGYKFNDEMPITKEYTKGTLAMANSGPNTNGSQFFIMNADYQLQKNYVIFGKVTAGLDTVDAIANTPTTTSGSGEKSKPTENIVIKTITINAN